MNRGAPGGRARTDRTAMARPILKSQRAAGGLPFRRRRSCVDAAPPTNATGSEAAKASKKRRFDASGDVGRPRRGRIGPQRRVNFEIAASRRRPLASKPPSPRSQRTPPGARQRSRPGGDASTRWAASDGRGVNGPGCAISFKNRRSWLCRGDPLTKLTEGASPRQTRGWTVQSERHSRNDSIG